MGMTVHPPIAKDVAEIIGAYAEKVDNRSLLLEKFVLHKSWPLVISEVTRAPVKLDDASRWSFIRMTQNGDAILAREQERAERDASDDRPNARPENIEKGKIKAGILRQIRQCSCRRLPGSLQQLKLRQNLDFARKLLSRPGHCAVVYGELEGRLIVNLSDSLIQNAGICLDRHTGLPYIPGSAVKGVVRHAALELLGDGDLTVQEFQTIFGTSEADFKDKGELANFAGTIKKEDQTRKGAVDFLAAQPVTEPEIEVDISTVHHGKYYQTGRTEDLGVESPIPNTFPVVKKGVRYAFCISGNGMSIPEDLFARTRELLIEAITVSGIGAKTGAGYGWFRDVTEQVKDEENRKAEADKRAAAAAAAAKEEVERKAKAAAEAARKSALSPTERLLEKWRSAGGVKAVINGSDITKFSSLSDEDKRAVVEVLRAPDGIGAEVWALLKSEESNKKRKIKHAPATVSAIKGFVKSMKLEKMP